MIKPRSLLRSRGAPVAVLLLAALALYARSFGHAWTLDDFPVVVENPDIRSLGQFFQNHYPGRPLRELTYLVDYRLFGLQPAGYHLQSILWHGGCAVLVFLLALRLRARATLAWLAALLFLVHPLGVEVTASVANRKDSLVLFFALAATLCYQQVAGSPRPWRWCALAAALAGVALSAKQNALALPLVWVALEWCTFPPERRLLLARPRWNAAVIAAGLLGSAGWYFFGGGRQLHYLAMQGVMAKMNLYLAPGQSLPYLLMMLKSWSFMALKLVWPFGLAAEYDYALPQGWLDLWVLATLAGLLVFALLLWYAVRRRSSAFFPLVWCGAFFLPVANLWPFSYFAADRYLYAPLVGFCILCAWGGERLLERLGAWRWGLWAPLLAGLAILTWLQIGVWQSPLTLWSRAVQINPESTTALNNLGSVCMQEGDLSAALGYFQRAARNFNSPLPYYNLGQVYEKLGDRQQALSAYRNFMMFNDPAYAQQADQLRRRIFLSYGILL